MSPLLPPLGPTSAIGAPLARQRCVRHEAREAVARCPACQGFFCRECVVEHEGKLLCATCLSKLPTARSLSRARRGNSVAKVAWLTLTFAAVWLCFYGLGSALLHVPPSLHDTTFWRGSDRASP